MPGSWTEQNPQTTGNLLIINKVVFNPTLGLWVAVGQRNGGIPTATPLVWTSPDAQTWTLQTASQGYRWQSVASNSVVMVALTNTVLTAIGGNVTDQVMTSTDGVTWVGRQSAERNGWEDIVWADTLGLFVAVADTSGDGLSIHRVMTSPDGINWTQQIPASITPSFGWAAIAWGNNTLVATATDAGATSVMTSPDGVHWTQRNTTISVSPRIRGLAYSSQLGLFVMSCGQGHVLRSPNGITWTDWNGIPAGWNSTLGHQCAWAPTGIGVTFDATPTDHAILRAATESPALGRFIISPGAGVANMISSTDGATWVLEVTPTLRVWDALGAVQLKGAPVGANTDLPLSPDGVSGGIINGCPSDIPLPAGV